MAELGRLVKAGAVNLTADAAAGAAFNLDAAALAAQPCRPQARHALPHVVREHCFAIYWIVLPTLAL